MDPKGNPPRMGMSWVLGGSLIGTPHGHPLRGYPGGHPPWDPPCVPREIPQGIPRGYPRGHKIIFGVCIGGESESTTWGIVAELKLGRTTMKTPLLKICRMKHLMAKPPKRRAALEPEPPKMTDLQPLWMQPL